MRPGDPSDFERGSGCCGGFDTSSDWTAAIALRLSRERVSITGSTQLGRTIVTLRLVDENDRIRWERKVRSDSKGRFRLNDIDLRRASKENFEGRYYDFVALTSRETCWVMAQITD